MSRFTDDDGRAARRRPPGGRRRWSAAERAGYLAAFRWSGGTVAAFCRRTGVPRATFTLWRRDEREERIARQQHGSALPTRFARVEVTSGGPDAAARATGITVRLHGQSMVTGELIGLDAATALRALRLLLRHQRSAHRVTDA